MNKSQRYLARKRGEDVPLRKSGPKRGDLSAPVSLGPSDTRCSEPECGGRAWARGLCNAHYGRAKREGAPMAPLSRAENGAGYMTTGYRMIQCSVEGCAALAHARTLCIKHYGRARKSGEPLPLGPKGQYGLGHENKRGYREVRSIDGDKSTRASGSR